MKRALDGFVVRSRRTFPETEPWKSAERNIFVDAHWEGSFFALRRDRDAPRKLALRYRRQVVSVDRDTASKE
jgi:hypothetical protein